MFQDLLEQQGGPAGQPTGFLSSSPSGQGAPHNLISFPPFGQQCSKTYTKRDMNLALEALRTNMSQSELLSVVKKSVLRRWRTGVRLLCCRCWDTEPLQRPDFSTLRHAVTKLNE